MLKRKALIKNIFFNLAISTLSKTFLHNLRSSSSTTTIGFSFPEPESLSFTKPVIQNLYFAENVDFLSSVAPRWGYIKDWLMLRDRRERSAGAEFSLIHLALFGVSESCFHVSQNKMFSVFFFFLSLNLFFLKLTSHHLSHTQTLSRAFSLSFKSSLSS